MDPVDLEWMQRHWPGMSKVEVEEQLQLPSNDTPLKPGKQVWSNPVTREELCSVVALINRFS